MEDGKITITSEWLKTNYDKLNKELFGGVLGDCALSPFTTGKGSNGRTLGWFGFNIGCHADASTRRMYVYVGGHKEYIDSSNIVRLCQPFIKLNANYVWTEKAALSTLLHEMCHYYTYKDGYAPTRGHGKEFYAIGNIVSSKSNGLFPVERLASAEEMNELSFSSGMLEKIGKRIEKNGAYCIFFELSSPYVYSPTKTYRHAYIKIKTKSMLDAWKQYIINDNSEFSRADLYECENLYEWGRLRSTRSAGTYYFTDDPEEKKRKLGAKFVESLMDEDGSKAEELRNNNNKIYYAIYNHVDDLASVIRKQLYGHILYDDEEGTYYVKPFSFKTNGITVKIGRSRQYSNRLEDGVLYLRYDSDNGDYDFLIDASYDENDDDTREWLEDYVRTDIERVLDRYTRTHSIEMPKEDSVPLFRLKLMNGEPFELRNVTKDEIKTKLKERFPKMSDETIERLINNKANYPQNEGIDIKSIVRNVIREYLSRDEEEETEKENGDVTIDPSMNLGLESPFEASKI